MKTISLSFLVSGCALLVITGTAYLNRYQSMTERAFPTKQESTQTIIAQHTFENSNSPKMQTDAILRAELTELKQEINALRLSSRDTPTGKKTMAAQPILTLAEQQQKAEAEEHERFQKVSAQFSQQQIDTNWSTQATKRLEEAMNNSKKSGLMIDTMECRTSMCKLEINDMDEKSRETFRNGFREQITDVFSAGMVGTDEYGKTIVYVASDAEELYGNE
jgi:hypothetical protein